MMHGREESDPAILERFPVWLNRDSPGRRNRGVCAKRFGFEEFHGQTLFVGFTRARGRGN